MKTEKRLNPFPIIAVLSMVTLAACATNGKPSDAAKEQAEKARQARMDARSRN